VREGTHHGIRQFYKMAFKKRFKVSDESVNDYGFWIQTSGLSLDQANRNCPAYFNHRTWEVPLGHWEDIKAEPNGEIHATIVIEGLNAQEKEYIAKIENGDIKGASIGVDPLTWTDESLLLKPGQSRPTLIKGELFEISLAPLPGNKNALALRKGNTIQLTSEEMSFIPSLNILHMKGIALKLGLPETATEQQIIDSITAVQLKAANAEIMRSHIEGEAAKSLTGEAEKNLFVELSKTNITQALSFLSLNKKAEVVADPVVVATGAATEKTVKVTDLIKPGVGLKKVDTAEGKDTFDYLQKHNPVELARIRKEDYAQYVQLAKEYSNGVRYKG